MTPPASTKTQFSAYGVTAVMAAHPAVRKLRRSNVPTIHGNKVWRSSFALMDYFTEHPLPQGAKVIDVGCGWGLTSIFLAKTFRCQVLGIDADPAVAPYLQLQAELNGVEITFAARKLQQLRKADFAGVHTVVGADICFWDELTTPLYAMIKRAMAAGVQQVLIADPGRPPFWDLAHRCEQRLDGLAFSRSVTIPARSTKQILAVRP